MTPVTNTRSEHAQRDEIDKSVAALVAWFPSLTGLVIGPGLGRDESVTLCAKQVIEEAKKQKMPLVIDGYDSA